MTKTSSFLIAAGAFTLGFFASEYRQQTQRPPAQQTAVAHLAAGHGHRLDSSSPTTTVPQTATSIPALPPTANEGFSWERVQQFIAAKRYEDAIGLLRSYLEEHNNSPQAWQLLAQTYEAQGNHKAALEAWFQYLDYVVDVVQRERAAERVKRYLVQLYEQPSLLKFNEEPHWLIAQLDALLGLSGNDGELHVILASLYAELEDNYQAQYHALMAANDPQVQDRAEEILAQLNDTNIPEGLALPLIRFGNQYLVNVTIEGHPARLLLDTGASISGVSTSYTAKYPAIVKSIKPIRLNTASGVEDSYLFTVDSLRLDSLAFNHHILAMLPMQQMTQFDGLLGVDILGRFDFVIDQDALLLQLKARK